jgi:dTMP kinase
MTPADARPTVSAIQASAAIVNRRRSVYAADRESPQAIAARGIMMENHSSTAVARTTNPVWIMGGSLRQVQARACAAIVTAMPSTPSPSSDLARVMAERDARRGLLIAFEGPEGSGKTTQQRLLRTWLESEGRDVVTSRWASSALVKPLIKSRKRLRVLTAEEYSLLHAVDFRHRLETEILPALWAGKTVIADRYLFTALARDAARGLDLDWLLHLYAPLVWPDLVVYFALDSQDSSRRVAATRAPRFYESGQDVTGLADPLISYRQFIDRVITEYENLAVIFHFVKVAADQAVYRQHQQVRRIVQEAARRPWPDFSAEALTEWLTRHPDLAS